MKVNWWNLIYEGWRVTAVEMNLKNRIKFTKVIESVRWGKVEFSKTWKMILFAIVINLSH